MSQDELLDLVDENGKIVCQELRSVCHEDPSLIHQVVHCWIFNSKGQILWQQRSLQKKLSPGKWDMSCGGHIKSGKSPDETIKEELEEELGVLETKVNFVTKYIYGNDKQTELIYLYYAILDWDESRFILQPEEVEKVKWLDIHEAQMKAYKGEVEATLWIFS